MMLRGLVVLLLLANGLFYAAVHGWLPPGLSLPPVADREPQRLAAQVRPEQIQVLNPRAASAALAQVASAAAASAAAARPVCLEAGPFAPEAIAAAENALAQAGLPDGAWSGSVVERPGSWLVYMGRYVDRETLQRKEDELRRLRIAFEVVRDAPALEPGLALGRFERRADADGLLAQMAQRGLRTARVVQLTPPAQQHWLRVPQADAAQRAQLAQLKSPALGAGFQPCVRPTDEPKPPR